MKTLQDFDLHNKTILVRVDYNVPISSGKITNDLRIRASLPTINYLLEKGAKQIYLISHLGRPEGKPVKEFSLAPVVKTLKKLLPNQTVDFLELPSNNNVSKHSDARIVLLENLRFDPGEEDNSTEFAKKIVNMTNAELFVQDGFAVLHRAHASTEAITKILPSCIGLLVKNELKNLTEAIKNPTHPALLVIGGAKITDKSPLIAKLSSKFDHIVVGGKIAADGYESNDSKIYVAEDFDETSEGKKLDIGPISTAKIAGLITDAKTILWNGLLGYAEDPAYATSSTIVAELIGEKTDATTIVCGGDTTGFVENLMKKHQNLKYSLISTGGGASLEFILGNKLPGLKAIKYTSL